MLMTNLANNFCRAVLSMVKDYSIRECHPALKFAHVLFPYYSLASLYSGNTQWGLCRSGYNNLPLLRALFTNRTQRVDRALPTHPELPKERRPSTLV